VPLLAAYVAVKIFKAMSSMFRGAHDIQYWLGEIGSRVCRALTPEQLRRIEDEIPQALKKTKGAKPTKTVQDLLGQLRSTIVWTTPLRMPVVQPYRKSGTRIIHTCMQALTLTMPEPSDPVHLKKQLQAFPPNFIHSLDASHMLLCALECESQGLTFAAVHDSFWTHAADVDTMNGILRDSFIRIHSEDVIARLAVEFQARYNGSLYLAKVNKGTEVEKLITAHRSKARLSSRDELLREKERLELLSSSDPEKVKMGAKMVTPGSIFEQVAEDKKEAAIEKEDVEEFALGNIPASEQAPLSAAGATADAVADAFDADLESAATDAETDIGDDADALSFDSNTDADALPSDDLDELTAEDHDSASEADGLSSMEQKYAANGPGSFADVMSPPAKKAPQKQKTIPAKPAKGEFDVRRLRDSQYFFS
jgi:DNA-directed RNA polymerase, mitochondrial